MCQQCTTNAISFGEVIPGWFLMRARRDGNTWKRGQWGLVWSNDPSFTWTTTPTPSPVFGMTDNEEEAWFEANEGTPEMARMMAMAPAEFRGVFECDPLTGYGLVTAAMERGYDPDKSGDFAYWLFDRIGEYLKTAEMTVPDQDDPFPDTPDNPTDVTIGRDPLPGEPVPADGD